MVNHIVLWNIKGDLSVQEKREAALTIKSKRSEERRVGKEC